MNIVIRTDASETIATGHVMRCLTLALKLRDHRHDVHFICRDWIGNLNALLESNGFSLHRLPGPATGVSGKGPRDTLNGLDALQDAHETSAILRTLPNTDWLIVDHYGLDSRWYREVRAEVSNIFAIDDLANREMLCDLLLDQTPGRTLTDYRRLVPPHCSMMLGARYALLRGQFHRHRSKALLKRSVIGGVRRILVFMGGTDAENVTQKVIEGLRRAPWDPYPVIDVVLRTSSPHLTRVKRAAASAGLPIRVLTDVDNMAELMLEADVAVGAGGTASWERCCLGLPAVLLILAENQRRVVQSLMDAGAAIGLGDYRKVTPEEISRQLHRLANDLPLLSRMSQSAFRVCDGRGVDRVMERIEQNPSGVKLREAGPDDMDRVFQWQTIPGVRRHSRNTNPPTIEEHRKWFAATLKNPRRTLFVLEQDGIPKGVLRLDKREMQGDNYEVSILIPPEHQGRGIGKAALRCARDRYPDATFWAQVFLKNKASQKLFLKSGYRPVGNDWLILTIGERT